MRDVSSSTVTLARSVSMGIGSFDCNRSGFSPLYHRTALLGKRLLNPQRQIILSSRIATAPAPGLVYSDRVNPQWVRLLDVLQMNVRYERCGGAELFTSDGRRILD